ncbi:hypothetical protein F0562_005516 [Nyssa sinensis]|uniref:Oxidation resistance protein 1 n=1 Tax=Nyssa sinensis TaxID=561372 RepID=A0A5J5AJN6_9ASTE|nr:hypothetical protein F0562_005516 [Nyssa sinensis]
MPILFLILPLFSSIPSLINPAKPTHPPPPPEDVTEPKRSQLESITEESSGDLVDGPDTSSFTAFLYSLLSSSESGDNSKLDSQNEAIYQAARFGGYQNQASDRKGSSEMIINDGIDSEVVGDEGIPMQAFNEPVPLDNLPEISEPSLLLSAKTRSALYIALPAPIQGRKWVLLYSTWRHGILLSTLYRRSMICPGLSLLVVGDRKGAVFGGLVEAPLRPTNKRKYQGTNNTFVFTNTTGHPVIFRPTGMNRYFTLCSTDFLALGGGSHFALYLDGLSGSSSASETYGNSCLAHSEDFEVKEVELWGFVYASKYEEMISLLRTEAPGICQW